MVAWHKVPGMRKKKEPVPEGRCDYVFARWFTKIVLALAKFRDGVEKGLLHNHPVPPGRIASFTPFQALRARLPSCSPSGTRKTNRD
jgi:hypothetical protein